MQNVKDQRHVWYICRKCGQVNMEWCHANDPPRKSACWNCKRERVVFNDNERKERQLSDG